MHLHLIVKIVTIATLDHNTTVEFTSIVSEYRSMVACTLAGGLGSTEWFQHCAHNFSLDDAQVGHSYHTD